MKNDIGIDSCNDIIQYNSKPSFGPLDQTDGGGFNNIKKPEKKEADDDKKDCFGYPQHRDEKSHYLIDHDSGIILSSPIVLGLP